MCKNAAVRFRNCSCPTCKPALALQARPLVPKEPTWLTAPSLTEMAICSDTLKLPSYAHIANTRHRGLDVPHPKYKWWGRHLPQHSGKVTGLGARRWPWAAMGNALDPQLLSPPTAIPALCITGLVSHKDLTNVPARWREKNWPWRCSPKKCMSQTKAGGICQPKPS